MSVEYITRESLTQASRLLFADRKELPHAIFRRMVLYKLICLSSDVLDDFGSEYQFSLCE